MKIPSKQQAIGQVSERLAEYLGTRAEKVRIRSKAVGVQPDAILEVGGITFLLEWRGSGGGGVVAGAVERFFEYAASMEGTPVRLVAVPTMGSAGREFCKRNDVAWLDLSGNARIVAPRLRILIKGCPDLFKRRGRPATAFAPKASRIARWLLVNSGRAMFQRDMAATTNMDEGQTSRVVSKLEEDGLVVRDESGAVRAKNPDLLLDAWREAYTFTRHEIIRGHVAARSGDELLRTLGESFRDRGVQHAATGLGAAWLMTKFAGFRLVTYYLTEPPSEDLLQTLSFREEPRGANVWLVVPNDHGVFHGGEDRDGISCVHPVQAYLDLAAHPERSPEAAVELRTRLLSWGDDV